MRTRTLGIFLAATLLVPLAARADDTKPPVISDVRASQKAGKVLVEAKVTDETGVLSAVCLHRKMGSPKFEESTMTKNEFDDTFKVSFAGAADTEYFIQSTDLLGNGPATYGSAGKPMSLGGHPQAVASAEPSQPAHEAQPVREVTQPREPREPKEPKEPRVHEEHHVASSSGSRHHEPKEEAPAAPIVMHHKPTTALPDGQDVVLHVRITAAAGLKQAALFARPKGYVNPDSHGSEYTMRFPVTNKSGDAYEVTIPGDSAHGTLEYFIVAQDNNGVKTNLGDPDVTHWFAINFKSGDLGVQPLVISSNPPAKVPPNQVIHIRAQATLPSASAEMSDADAADAETKIDSVTAKLLYRTQDAGDQSMDMSADLTGGLGGFIADLPPQPDGNPVYYQVVMCLADKCAIDTGSKHKWNSFSATTGDPIAPAPLNAVSSKGPSGLPD